MHVASRPDRERRRRSITVRRQPDREIVEPDYLPQHEDHPFQRDLAPLDEGSSELFAFIGGTDGQRREPAWYFTKVPESKRAKNRLPLDLVDPDPSTVETSGVRNSLE